MANRIIKDSILTSPNFNRLSVHAERHFYRILMLTDDYGCFEATPDVVRGKCYPLQFRQISAKDVERWQNELGEKGILLFWIDDGRVFGIFRSFDKHNAKYAVTSDGKPTRRARKTPIPPDSEAGFCQSLPSFAEIASFEKNCLILNPQSSIHNSQPSNEMSDDSDDIPYKEIIDDLNSLTGQKLKHTTKDYRGLIRARFREGYKLEDFKTVNRKKAKQWLGDKSMVGYLVPGTLYALKHFDSYLNQPEVENQNGVGGAKTTREDLAIYDQYTK